ncbi:MAG TPA: aminotransferase class V-fold PLP-dependent enzyme, partial [Candidatus Tumulicola sp.]|nr:aminotransferase class V-fold PLP-dependent enzyme [Candidatus Tumulicola sp.]
MSHESFSRIYLDYAATTPLREESARAMQAIAGSAALNPSSLHAEGRRARALLDDARERVASLLGASRKEIEFTGGGTESDNHALGGVVRALPRRGRIVVGATEHHAVLHAAAELAREGNAVTRVPVDGDGRIDPDAFAGALNADALLASVMYANNEIGTVAPIAQLAAQARASFARRRARTRR